MIITPYSFLTAVIWFSLFILVSDLLRRKMGFSIYCSINVLMVFLVLSVVRLCVPIELPITKIVSPDVIFRFYNPLLNPIFNFNGYEITFLLLLISIWIIGTVVCLFSLFSRMAKDKKVLQAFKLSEINDERLERFFCSEATTKQKSHNVIVSPLIPSPMVVGLLNPTILLPKVATELSENQLRHVLMHEQTHIENKDLWVKLLIELLCCLMWWFPPVYLLKQDLDRGLELKCDLTLTRKMDDNEKHDYLSTIMSFLKTTTKEKPNNETVVSAFGFLSIKSEFDITQRFLLVKEQSQNTKLKSLAFVFAMCAVFLLSYTVVFQPVHAPPMEDLMGEDIITAKNAYILAKADGTYWLISDFGYKHEITEEELLSDELYKTLPVK